MGKPIMGIGNRTCKAARILLSQEAHVVRYDVNEKYGTAADLLALSNALHDRGMYLMVDVVANHMVSDKPHSI